MTFLITLLLHFLLAGSNPRAAYTFKGYGYTRATVWCSGNSGLFIGELTKPQRSRSGYQDGEGVYVNGRFAVIEGPVSKALIFVAACEEKH